ncbi:prolipoprotein diacylglyceryl transferase [Nitrincola tapanii]|uniref:Phosphatidylglycerol--prolipoprotein diacylglyceryl transferase n=1 Tax=Nitrincola tapanii TaxID=1708751 RepID=A0A5A9W7Y0_9GAMM|nr:prolipoprotein diacylglyceryl transferase [Nitrincola tapanii]KAA0876218.1 prolipoprotein diacylglyceryl transferase [Nitrincola tapanii]
MWVHEINPVALDLGRVQIHWYGLMYVIGFAAAWWLGLYRARQPGSGWTEQQVSDLVFWGAMGVILGGRAGYVLFYHFDYFLQDPLWLFAIWQGGMSFHGGLIGVVLALALLGRRYQKSLFEMGDFVAPLIPIGLGAGRLGNFIGGELWGRPTDLPWAVIFPAAGDHLARHPSQLYQMLLEGLVLFVILWWFTARPRPRMAASGLFLLSYAVFRALVELFREPDAQLGVLAFGLTMGQWLSLPMLLAGATMLLLAYAKPKN